VCAWNCVVSHEFNSSFTTDIIDHMSNTTSIIINTQTNDNGSIKMSQKKRKQCHEKCTSTMNTIGIPSRITTRMELNEWAVSLLFVDVVHPSPRLSTLLHELGEDHHRCCSDSEKNHHHHHHHHGNVHAWMDHVRSVLNEILSRFMMRTTRMMPKSRDGFEPAAVTEFFSTCITIQPFLSPSQSSATATLGYVHVSGTTPITADQQFLKAMVALYFHSLETILYDEKIRNDDPLSSSSSLSQPYWTKGHEVRSNVPKTVIQSLLRQDSFHRALVACCYVSVSQAVESTRKIRPTRAMTTIPIYTLLPSIVQSSPYDFIKTLEIFFVPSLSVHSAAYNHPDPKLGGASPWIVPLPRRIVTELQIMVGHVMDSVLWACHGPVRTGTWAHGIRQLPAAAAVDGWPPKCLRPALPDEQVDGTIPVGVVVVHGVHDEPDRHEVVECGTNVGTRPRPSTVITNVTREDHAFDRHAVDFIMERLLSMAQSRILQLCRQLRIRTSSNDDDDDNDGDDGDPMVMVSHQMYIVFRYILRNYVHLFCNRHVDHWILCVMYGVTRSIKYPPELKFAQIISAYMAVRTPEIGTATCQQIVRQVILVPTDPDHVASTEMGNVISLYNLVFVPTMKDYLLNSHSLRLCSVKLAKLRRNCE
jgi:Retinoblastoma-associated protein B domain